MPFFSGSLNISGSIISTGLITSNGSPVVTSNNTSSFVINTGSFATTGSNLFNGNQTITGSVTSTGGFTGSLLGTATTSTTASYATVAQTLLGSVVSASYAATASVLLGGVVSASYATTSSYAEVAESLANPVSLAWMADSVLINQTNNNNYYPLLFATPGGYASPTADLGDNLNYSPGFNILNLKGTQVVSGSIISTGGFTGSLQGTATTASYIDPSFAFNNGNIDANIYFSTINWDIDFPMIFGPEGGNTYGVPTMDTQTTVFTYNPSTQTLKLTGSLAINSLGAIVRISNLPTTEPTSSGQLWLSGSAGSNSKVLCVRN